MISSLDRKLLRDLSHMKGRATAIAFVIAAGVATFVNSQSMLHSLELTRSTYYERHRFAQVFAQLRRAPDALAERIDEIPGVAQVQTRIVEAVNLDVPGLDEPAVGQIISIPTTREPVLNQLYLRRGRMLAPRHDDEVLVSESFCQKNELAVGDQIAAIINGRRKRLRIVGQVLSPEFVFQVKPGDILPDPEHFAVLWMEHEALANAFDMEGAFNDVALSLMRGASEPEVIHRLDELLDPYGGLGAFGRKDQLSHMLLESDIEGLRTTGLIAPTIFLCVAAFLVNVVLTRLTSLQREQIAALKAFGYTKLEIGWHLLKFVLLITIVGGTLGTIGGALLSREFTKMIMSVYQYPEIVIHVRPNVAALALLVAGGAAVLGAMGAVWRAVSLQPAEAMRPEPPHSYKPTLLERAGLGPMIPNIARMVIRQLERHPVKTAFSVIAIGTSVGIIVVGNFMQDSIDYVMQSQFHDVQRYDMLVTTNEAVSDDAVYELANLPGVIYCEPVRVVPTRLRHEHRSRRVAITGLPADSELFHLRNRQGRRLRLPPGGLVLSRKLAELLNIGIGEMIRVEVMEEKRPRLDVPVVALLDDVSGLNAYMEATALQRALRESRRANGAYLRTDPLMRSAIYRELKRTPQVAGVTVQANAIKSFQDTIAENMGTMRVINLGFAVIIAIGVVYNSAQISLSERERELATLRVIGFTRREISAILLGEIGTVTLLAVPLGLVIGYCFAVLLTTFLDQEVFRFPLVIEHSTYGLAASVVLAASIVSALYVRRQLDHLDLIAVLKSRE